MRKTWILDTETKGTGAHVVPLEQVTERGRRRSEPVFVPRRPRPRPAPAPAPRPPRRFKVVDVMTREVLAEHAGTRATVDLLSDVRSIVDVNVYVWLPGAERWRLLTN